MKKSKCISPSGLKKRKDGRYVCVYKNRYFYGKTAKEAYLKRQEYISNDGKSYTVKSYSEEWLPVAKSSVRSKTMDQYKHFLDLLNSVVGNKKPENVIPSDIKKVYAKYFKNASNSHIKHARNLYSCLFEAMKDDGLTCTNPVKSPSAKPHKGYAGSHRAITDEERYYIETTEHPLRPALMGMLYAGLRNGEVLALDVDRDIDFDEKKIHVSHFWHVDKNSPVIDSDGKTDNAKRIVPLFQPLEEILLNKHGLVATMGKGKPFTKSGWFSAWSSYVTAVETRMNGCRKRWYGKRAIDIERKKVYDKLIREGKTEEAEQYRLPPWKSFTVKPYDLRHSFCAYCRDLGVDQHVLKNWMGHSNSQLIMEVYDHVSDKRENNEIQKVRGTKDNLVLLQNTDSVDLIEKDFNRIELLFELVEKGTLSAAEAMEAIRGDIRAAN